MKGEIEGFATKSWTCSEFARLENQLKQINERMDGVGMKMAEVDFTTK